MHKHYQTVQSILNNGGQFKFVLLDESHCVACKANSEGPEHSWSYQLNYKKLEEQELVLQANDENVKPFLDELSQLRFLDKVDIYIQSHDNCFMCNFQSSYEDNPKNFSIPTCNCNRTIVFSLSRVKKSLCDECEPLFQFADECQKPVGFENVRFSHGLIAYVGQKSFDAAYENLSTLLDNLGNPQFEICASESGKHVGKIGCYVEGEVKAVAKHDINSHIHENGRRFFPKVFKDELIFHRDEFFQSSLTTTLQKTYHEIIMVPTKLHSLWVSTDVEPSMLKQMQDLSAQLNVRLYYVLPYNHNKFELLA